jgi:hypothetical protein
MVVALSHRRVWWLNPQKPAVATTTPIDGELLDFVVASHAEVAVVSRPASGHALPITSSPLRS